MAVQVLKTPGFKYQESESVKIHRKQVHVLFPVRQDWPWQSDSGTGLDVNATPGVV